MRQHSTPQCRLALAENCSVRSTCVSSTPTHTTSPAPPTPLPPRHRPRIRHVRQRSGRSSIPSLSPAAYFSLPDASSPLRVANSLSLVVLVPGCGSEHRAKTSGNDVHERGGADQYRRGPQRRRCTRLCTAPGLAHLPPTTTRTRSWTSPPTRTRTRCSHTSRSC
ncbi:hypothetical protein B0H13DRAFT_1072640 [Mycena leptocephala]|nr:hypothetical protein B0H13DRAFT_1072640 [Mycena leptocephala]